MHGCSSRLQWSCHACALSILIEFMGELPICIHECIHDEVWRIEIDVCISSADRKYALFSKIDSAAGYWIHVARAKRTCTLNKQAQQTQLTRMHWTIHTNDWLSVRSVVPWRLTQGNICDLNIKYALRNWSRHRVNASTFEHTRCEGRGTECPIATQLCWRSNWKV